MKTSTYISENRDRNEVKTDETDISIYQAVSFPIYLAHPVYQYACMNSGLWVTNKVRPYATNILNVPLLLFLRLYFVVVQPYCLSCF